MKIVDAQVHIWSGGKPGNPRHRQIPAFTKDDLLKEMAAAGVDAAVIHPPTSWDPNANALAIEAARMHPDRFAILGNFPLDKPESRALIDGWKRQPGMLGLRFTFLQPHMKSWPTDGTIEWLWSAAERAGLPVALLFEKLDEQFGRLLRLFLLYPMSGALEQIERDHSGAGSALHGFDRAGGLVGAPIAFAADEL